MRARRRPRSSSPGTLGKTIDMLKLQWVSTGSLRTISKRLTAAAVTGTVFAGCFLLPGRAGAAEQVVVSAARHKIQVQDPALAAQLAAQGGRLVADYGGFQVYE